MDVVGEVQDRLDVDPGVGVGAPLTDLLGGDRAAGLVEPGESAGAEDGGVLEVDVQHHLPRRAGEGLVRSAVRSRVVLVSGEVFGRDRAAYVEESVEPSSSCRWASAVSAASRSIASARSSRHPLHGPGGAGLGEGQVEVAGLGGRWRSASVLFGVEPGPGLLDQPTQLRRPDVVRERRHRGVHEPGRFR